jgi:CRP-like cAMP-binding protein
MLPHVHDGSAPLSNDHQTLRVTAARKSVYVRGNDLLDALSPSDRDGLEDDLDIVVLAARDLTHAMGEALQFVDFPIDAVLSVVATLESGDTIEVATIGREGLVEFDAALGAATSQRTAFCQVAGTVARMPIHRFEQRMANSVTWANMVRRNVRAALFSAQQLAACNAKHSILQRCARWLSMTEDRVGREDFTLTHEFLAMMLGVRRAGVSEAAETLQKLGAIVYRHGSLTVRNSRLLNSVACECYQSCKLAFAASFLEEPHTVWLVARERPLF